jgi:uncharacterized membrane protein YecN with MAPEG domain
MPITALFAALLAPIFLALSLRVIARRREGGTSLGDGGDAVLLRRMRVHANFAEYAPFGLVLLGLAESLHSPTWLLYALGLLLLLGRLLHAIGMSREPGIMAFRSAGMALTFTMLGAAALTCLGGALRGL